MFYLNCGKGSMCGAVQLVEIKVRRHHGKPKPVAIYRYHGRQCIRYQESPIRVSNGRMIFNSGAQRTLNIIPPHLAKKYAHLLE